MSDFALQTGTFIYQEGVLGYKWDFQVTIYQMEFPTKK